MLGAVAASDNLGLATKPRFFSHGSPILCKIPPSRGNMVLGRRCHARRVEIQHVVARARVLVEGERRARRGDTFETPPAVCCGGELVAPEFVLMPLRPLESFPRQGDARQ